MNAACCKFTQRSVFVTQSANCAVQVLKGEELKELKTSRETANKEAQELQKGMEERKTQEKVEAEKQKKEDEVKAKKAEAEFAKNRKKLEQEEQERLKKEQAEEERNAEPEPEPEVQNLNEKDKKAQQAELLETVGEV